MEIKKFDYQIKLIRERNVFKLLVMFGYFLDVNFMFFATHPAPNVMIGPTIASGVILNPNIIRECIALSKFKVW